MTNTVRFCIRRSIPFSISRSVLVSMELVASSRITPEVWIRRLRIGQQLPLSLGQVIAVAEAAWCGTLWGACG